MCAESFTLESKKPKPIFKTDPTQTVRPSLKVKDVKDVLATLHSEELQTRERLSKTKKALNTEKFLLEYNGGKMPAPTLEEYNQKIHFMEGKIRKLHTLHKKLKRSLIQRTIHK